MASTSKTVQKDLPETEERTAMTESFKLTKAEIPGRRVHSVYGDIIAEVRACGRV
jgi:hypothetical protein